MIAVFKYNSVYTVLQINSKNITVMPRYVFASFRSISYSVLLLSMCIVKITYLIIIFDDIEYVSNQSKG